MNRISPIQIRPRLSLASTSLVKNQEKHMRTVKRPIRSTGKGWTVVCSRRDWWGGRMPRRGQKMKARGRQGSDEGGQRRVQGLKVLAQVADATATGG